MKIKKKIDLSYALEHCDLSGGKNYLPLFEVVGTNPANRYSPTVKFKYSKVTTKIMIFNIFILKWIYRMI